MSDFTLEEVRVFFFLFVINHPEFLGIKIEFIGESHTFWQERKERKGPDGKTEHYHVHFSGSEEYFNFNYFLYGNHAGKT